jgi:hypothetical protein
VKAATAGVRGQVTRIRRDACQVQTEERALDGRRGPGLAGRLGVPQFGGPDGLGDLDGLLDVEL